MTTTPQRIPRDWPVQPIRDPNPTGAGLATCGACGLTWDDEKPTSMTPAPSARCPFEPFHNDHDTIAEYLAAQGYEDLDDWARDSDYTYEPNSGEWYRADELGTWPPADPVDIEGCFAGAMEAAGIRIAELTTDERTRSR